MWRIIVWKLSTLLLSLLVLRGTSVGAGVVKPPQGASPMAVAVLHYIDEFFVHKTSVLALAVHVSSGTTQFYFDDLIAEIVQARTESNIKIELNRSQFDAMKFEFYNIVMTDSYVAFSAIEAGRRSQREDFSEFYLIILHTSPHAELDVMREIAQIFQYCWRYYIVNVALLVDSQEAPLTLYTYYPFSATNCHDAAPKVVAVGDFIGNLSGSALFPEKFSNFHNCALTAVLWNVPPYMRLPRNFNGSNFFDGLEGRLLHVLADVLNFSIAYVTPPRNEQRGLIMRNGTLSGAVRILQQRRGDLSLGCFRCTLERSTTLSPSSSFYQTVQVFTVLAKREPWSTYEILIYPFDIYVWTALVSLFVVPIITGVPLHCLLPATFQFIYGFSHCSQLIFNWTAVGLGQVALPVPIWNFARFVLTMWLLLTFVLRSSYQGLLFDFLHMRKTVAPPSTMQQLALRGYQLIVNAATNDTLSGVMLIQQKQLKMLVMNITDNGGFGILEQNAERRLATVTPRDFLTDYANSNRRYGVFHVLHETVFSQQLCIYYTKHSYLVKPIDAILLNLRSFGLIDHWAAHYINEARLRWNFDERSALVALSMKQLYGIFLIQIYLWLIATLVFLAELLWSRRRT